MDALMIFKFGMLGAFALMFAWFFYKNNQIDKKYADKTTKH